MTPRIIRTVVSVSLFLCLGIIKAHSQALDIVNAAGDTLVHVKNDGNVGIGTTVPTGKLTIGSGQILVPTGSEITPSYSFSDDTDSGIYNVNCTRFNGHTKHQRLFFIF